MTDAAIEAAARALHRFNAPRVANDVEPWEAVPPNLRERWKRQATLALMAAEATRAVMPVAPADPFAALKRPNVEHDEDVTKVEQ